MLGLSLGMALTPLAGAATSAQQQLLEQVRLGEATHREDLVRQSLYRPELIDPNDPQVIAARFRYLLRRGIATGRRSYLTGWRNWRRSRRRINLPAPRCCSPRRKDASLCRRRVYWRRPAILNKRSPATTSCLKVIRRRANWRSNTDDRGEIARPPSRSD
ncbi:hypothetical protein JS565_16545 [Salmonella enterica subsp. enterica serovar Senftenberg]|nr:hypothetical protein [Salmonella enterica subsp. enterica serovar Senftenberg]